MKNQFLRHIYDIKKAEYKFIPKIKLMIFIHKLKTVSPSFDMLWDIADMIHHIEMSYMERPSNTLILTLDKTTKKQIRVIKPTYNFSIKLDYDTKKISIDRAVNLEKNGPLSISKSITSSITFIDGDPSVIKNEHDEQLFITIIDSLMEEVSDILRSYI